MRRPASLLEESRVEADDWLIALVRAVNLIVWLELGRDLLNHGSTPLPQLARRLIVVVIVAGMGILLIGAFAPALPTGTARLLYTFYTGFAAMVAVAVRWTWRG